jgi:hypothetical protein
MRRPIYIIMYSRQDPTVHTHGATAELVKPIRQRPNVSLPNGVRTHRSNPIFIQCYADCDAPIFTSVVLV